MKTLRLTELLLPLLAACGWAPWPIEPGVRVSATRSSASGPTQADRAGC